MMKVNLVLLTLWSVSSAAYVSRMNNINRVRTPSVFRPGMMLQRPMFPVRQMASASYRTPYLAYRNKPYRYAVKKATSSPIRNVFASPWRSTTRLPTTPPAAHDFVRSAAPPIVSADGAIHTIPAPNLSLSEKPIVVADSSENTASQSLRPMYEVTEKYAEQPMYQFNAKIEQPVGFSKPPPISQTEMHNRNNAAWQVAPDYGFQSIISQPSFVPQQFPMQGLMNGVNGIQVQNDFINRGPEGIIIPTNSFFQSDPLFLQKLQSQLVQQFPTIEFIPFTSGLQNNQSPQQQLQFQPMQQQQPQLQILPHPQPQPQHQLQSPQPQLTVLPKNEQIQPAPDHYVAQESQKSVVLTGPPNNSYASLKPQAFSIPNGTVKQTETTTEPQPQNATVQLSTETQAPTTTLKYVIESISDAEKTTPIYYAQVGQSINNDVANSLYSAINDVRAAAALAQVEKPEEVKVDIRETTTSTTTTPIPPKTTQAEPKTVTQANDKFDKNQTMIDMKNLVGSPFEKAAESVNVAYTLLRTDEKQPKFDKDGSVFAGQLVEASVSEDQDFNKEKATLARRPPLRLVAVTEKKTTEMTPQRVTVVKAKIPPKSKLTFDDKTGEPVLRIYASYIDNQAQKDLITAKLTNMKPKKDSIIKKQDSFDSWNAATVKTFDSTLSDMNQVTQFGLKIKARSDVYEPLFDEYDE